MGLLHLTQVDVAFCMGSPSGLVRRRALGGRPPPVRGLGVDGALAADAGAADVGAVARRDTGSVGGVVDGALPLLEVGGVGGQAVEVVVDGGLAVAYDQVGGAALDVRGLGAGSLVGRVHLLADADAEALDEALAGGGEAPAVAGGDVGDFLGQLQRQGGVEHFHDLEVALVAADHDVGLAAELPLHDAAGLEDRDGVEELDALLLVGLVDDEGVGAEFVRLLSAGGGVGALDAVLGHEGVGALAGGFGVFGAGVGGLPVASGCSAGSAGSARWTPDLAVRARARSRKVPDSSGPVWGCAALARGRRTRSRVFSEAVVVTGPAFRVGCYLFCARGVSGLEL